MIVGDPLFFSQTMIYRTNQEEPELIQSQT